VVGGDSDGLKIVDTIELSFMVCVLFLVGDHGSTGECLMLLFEDACLDVVRIFLVNTYVVPRSLLLLNTVA